MNIVLHSTDRLLLSIDRDELSGISNAINEVCNGIHIDDQEFRTRLGVPRHYLREVLEKLLTSYHIAEKNRYERTDAWSDGGSVQAICVTACGDPVDMSVDEARDLVAKLQLCIEKADGQR